MNETPSAWKQLVDEWVERELRVRPETPIAASSVRVRDSVEHGDQAFVLVSYDVDWPWPKEEDSPGARRSANTAVLQAERVRQPWIERDATRSRARYSTASGTTVNEHVLGERRVFSGAVEADGGSVVLGFDDRDSVEATVVEGWFVAVVDGEPRIATVTISTGGAPEALTRVADDAGIFADSPLAPVAGDAMYFSPLDLRTVVPLVQWVRSGEIVVVASCLEVYDEGCVLRLRIDGIRADEDTFVSWPFVRIEQGGADLGGSVCGEFSLADTISLDIGFKPALPPGARAMRVVLDGLRGANGPVDQIVLDVTLPA